MKEKKVSLIVAVYKSEEFLPKLINSLIHQTYKNIEIILVDDGSPDKSGKICDDFAQKDNRIRVIHQKNKGTCEARNTGLRAADGEYVMIIDGDDWLELDCVSYMMKLINFNNADMAYSDHLFTTRDRKQINNDAIEEVTPEVATISILYPYMKLGPWNKIYSKKLLDKYNISFSVPWFGEGLYFSTTAAQHSRKIVRGHRKVYNYRLNNEHSGLTVYNVQHGINALKNIVNIEENLYINTERVRNAVKWHKWHTYFFLLREIIGSNEKNKYNNLYHESIKYLRTNMPSVLVKSEVDIKNKIKIFVIGMAPIAMAKVAIKKSSYTLSKDNMK